MNIAALVANVIQLLIILALFFIRGLDLGPLAIFLLFLLMPIPFINFLALFFTKRSIAADSADDSTGNGLIKREALRILYEEDRCPVLTVGETAYAVRDLSEGGVRIRAGAQAPFKKKVNGEIRLLNGDPIRFKATILRREEGEVVFKFTEPVGTAILMEEKRVLAAAHP
ncbi:PilZ domain-containing protein [uncultured Desulfosarcina sp.]|uniref:PilZ domain-containing protein n=1 Tax=uncultured Desulfosarcina sp. TaxID=218289 RepID=UPI0029C6A206|nr:PilZ domain-containing protein [uncultured Desulfosarcina sp.]